MPERICLIGFDEKEIGLLKDQISGSVIGHPTLPKFQLVDGVLFVDRESGSWQVPVDRVVYHGIFEDDFDLFIALNLWGGPCFPNPLGMLDCRLKHACLVRALAVTDFPGSARGFAPAGAQVSTEIDTVAKWGNWHCGENKDRFNGVWTAEFSSTLEPYYEGEAVRIVLIGDDVFQIKLAGSDWKKSIHDDSALLTQVDVDLVEDTKKLASHFGLQVIANDYIVGPTGKFLLEVNHIPNVTRFPEIWDSYSRTVIDWCS